MLPFTCIDIVNTVASRAGAGAGESSVSSSDLHLQVALFLPLVVVVFRSRPESAARANKLMDAPTR